jgi:hypothetical protein
MPDGAMTGEVDRATVIRLLEAANGEVARACAGAMGQDPRDRLKGPTERASDLYRVYKLKAEIAGAGRIWPGFPELTQMLEKEGDRLVALFQTKWRGEVFSIYTDASVSRLIGYQINRDSQDSNARRDLA